MGQLQLEDTGLLTTTSSSAGSEARAYGDSGVGTPLTLQGAEATYNFEAMVASDSPILKMKDNSATGYFQYGSSDAVGVRLPVWTVRGYMKRSEETDMITWGRLCFMCQTKGVKKLYSAGYDSTWRDIIAYSKYGEKEYNAEATKTTAYIWVRIKSLSVTQATKDGFYYQLNLVETA